MPFSIAIIAATNLAATHVYLSGDPLYHVITKNEEKTFQIDSNKKLENLIYKAIGEKPEYIYLHSPAVYPPWFLPINDLYKEKGWSQVITHLEYENAKINEVKNEIEIVESKIFRNNSSIEATFGGEISTSKTQTAETNWSNSNSVSNSQSINYNIQFEGIGGSGSNAIEFTKEWGTGGSNTAGVTLTSGSNITIKLKPGESVVADLIAYKNVIDIDISYKAYLDGYSAIYSYNKYHGHNSYRVSIKDALIMANLNNNKIITEKIKINYYSGSRVELSDMKGKILKTYNYGINGELLNVETPDSTQTQL